MRRPFKDAMVALSLANLCFIPSWRYILEPSSSDYYYSWKAFPRWSELAAISVNVLILAACFWTCVYVVRRFGRPTLFTTGRIFVVLVFLVVLNDVRIQLVFLQRPTLVATLGTGGFIGLISLLTVVAVVLAIRVGLTQTARAVQATLLVLFPVFVVTFLHAFWLTTKFDAVVVSAKPPAIQQAKHANARILWVIFDELDY